MKHRLYKIALFLVLGTLIVGIALYALELWRLEQLYQEAYQEFVDSRGQSDLPVDSYEFITWGIKSGATEVEVNQVFSNATMRVQGGEVMNTNWDGFVNIYEFNYGKPFQDVSSMSENGSIKEVFWIFFDNEGRSRKLRRLYFARRGSSVVDIDLDKKTMD